MDDLDLIKKHAGLDESAGSFTDDEVYFIVKHLLPAGKAAVERDPDSKEGYTVVNVLKKIGATEEARQLANYIDKMSW